ncbi:hypothetical protein EWM64_g648 [Hericium alpestre]|uniref:MYND-type domain-containing protein n=1 Tax=Hericium alpestre TaxID=135208 RepID=A0A4Z0AAT5_9AGAM|nr:hypothetical protein EWM64_g648 [Hericium alpestre]
MAHPFYWPSQYWFYPIGNTPAVSLTRDIAPEDDVDLLLLGCGEARNVLYTISCEPPNASRRLDFTCCDNDPAILARNVLLFSLIADGGSTAHIWNINFHMYLDKKSHLSLVEQCKKLIELSETHERWAESPYGTFLRVSSDYTLSELRRHWGLYCAMNDLPSSRLKPIRNAFTQQSKSSPRMGTVLSSNRSAGPLMDFAGQTPSEHFQRYWKTGISSSSPGDIEAATLLNPTFVYSLAGEGCNVHYGSDPLISFHLAALFGNSKKSVTVSQMVKVAKAEFADWCSAYHATVSAISLNRPVVRFLTAEAIVACRSLRIMATTGTLKLNIAVDQWKTQLMELSRDEYVVRRAPVMFHVVDTSNLDDHIGPLNVLTIAIPLLSSNPSSVLYTESLVSVEQDATKQFAEHLHADITSLALVTGLCPTSYLSGFTSRSNTHELVSLQGFKKRTGEQPAQFHEMTTWKVPESGDALFAKPLSEDTSCCVLFNSRQLATFLYDMYHRLLERADPLMLFALNQQNIRRMVESSNLVHFVIVPPAGPLKPDGMKLNLFPVTRRKGFLSSWNIHRINLSQLPVLDVKVAKLAKWFNPHVGYMMSIRERHMQKKHEDEALMLVKDSLQTILVQSAGSQKGSPQRLFTLRGIETGDDETLLFISDLRYDLPCHTIVCDGYVLPLQPDVIGSNPALGSLVTKGKPVVVYEGEMRIWKQLLRAFIERCRSWRHTENCEYASQGLIPSNEETDEVFLCSCGHGKDTESMSKNALWKPLAPYVTRIALSPLFAVSYLETVIRDPDAQKCYVCRRKGKPKLNACAECKKVRYCSVDCQNKDWKAHKPKCHKA